MIERFRGEHFFLSNMYPLDHPIMTDDGAPAYSSEHAYQSEKFANAVFRVSVATVTAQERALGERLDGIASKNMAHELIDEGEPLRHNWAVIKLAVMEEVIRRKFTVNPDIRDMLADTGDHALVEGNTWGDNFWGVDPSTGQVGQNNLGKILTLVRTDIQNGNLT